MLLLHKLIITLNCYRYASWLPYYFNNNIFRSNVKIRDVTLSKKVGKAKASFPNLMIQRMSHYKMNVMSDKINQTCIVKKNGV